MRHTQLLAVICCLLFLGTGMAGSEEKPFFHNPAAPAPPPAAADPMKVVVWLKEDSVIVGSRTFCFTDEFLVEKEMDLLIYTQAYGPIGVKEVVDALRMAPDEPDERKHLPRNQVWNFDLPPSELLHIVWQPSEPAYYFYIEQVPPGEESNCDYQPLSPPLAVPPFLVIQDKQGKCSSILLKRSLSGLGPLPISLRVTVPIGCQ